MNRIGIILFAAFGLFILISASAYTVNESEQVIITQFGDPVAAVRDPGLHFRIPFIQKVNSLEKRLLPWDGAAENMPTKDKKRIFIDVWARWHIVDPMQYFKALRTTRDGHKILDDLIDSASRDVVARYNLIEAVRSTNDELYYALNAYEGDVGERRQDQVTAGRQKMEAEMLAAVNANNLAKTYGLDVTDIHIKRVNYVETVRQQVYKRMTSERTRIAQLFESEAKEERNRILGTMRKKLDEIEGEMQQKSAEIRGHADAEVITIYAEAIGRDLEFYEFLRQLEAYKQTFNSGTRLILSTDNEFLSLLRGDDIK